jgi:hypothetical protein
LKNLYPVTQTITAVQTPDALTEGDVDAYTRTGFLAVENVLSPDEIKAARADIEALLHERVTGVVLMPEPDQQEQFELAAPGERAHLVRKLMYFLDAAPRLREVSGYGGVLAIVERLVGEQAGMI